MSKRTELLLVILIRPWNPVSTVIKAPSLRLRSRNQLQRFGRPSGIRINLLLDLCEKGRDAQGLIVDTERIGVPAVCP